MKKIAITFLVGLLGAFVFKYLSLPLPWMLGPLLSVAIASNISIINIEKPSKKLVNSARMVIGVTVGSAFSASILSDLSHYIFSILLIVPFAVAATFLGIYYYTKIGKLDRNSAFFASMPGGFIEMILLAESAKADLKNVALAQSSRLMVIVLALPFLIHTFLNIDLPKTNSGSFLPSLFDIGIIDLLLMFLCGVFGWFLAIKIKLGAPSLLGPMIISVIFYCFGFINYKPPFEIINIIQLILGVSIGASFVGLKFKEYLKVIFYGMGHAILLILLAIFFGSFSIWITGEDWLSVLLAFSPGGQSDMNLIAILVGANIPFVALHHTFRLFIIMAILPVIHRRFKDFNN